VIAAASAPENLHRRAIMGQSPNWAARVAARFGLDIDGFRYSIDAFAVRHIRTRHSDSAVELSRGQLQINDEDISNIPEIFNAPNDLIFGARSRRRQPMIGYIKRFPTCVILYLVEIRPGRRELAAISMRNYPAGTLSGAIAGSLESNGRTDGGDVIHIVEITKNVTPFALERKPPSGANVPFGSQPQITHASWQRLRQPRRSGQNREQHVPAFLIHRLRG